MEEERPDDGAEPDRSYEEVLGAIADGRIREFWARHAIPQMQEALSQWRQDILRDVHAAIPKPEEIAAALQQAAVQRGGGSIDGNGVPPRGHRRDEAVERLVNAISKYLEDPLSMAESIANLYKTFKSPSITPGSLSIAQLHQVWDAHPREMEYLAAVRSPDPMMAMVPQAAMTGFRQGFRAKVMAEQLRRRADWLEEHADDEMPSSTRTSSHTGSTSDGSGRGATVPKGRSKFGEVRKGG